MTTTVSKASAAGLPQSTYSSLVEEYDRVRRATESLAQPLTAEDQTVQTTPDISPTKWHRAHTTWFFERFVLGVDDGYEPVNPIYWYLFNSYYESAGPRYPRPHRGHITRPGVAAVGEYRSQVDDRVRDYISGLSDVALSQIADLIELGLNHEQQHQELLLMDIKHVFSVNPMQPAYVSATDPEPRIPDAATWIDVPGGIVDIGFAGSGFHFDNEAPRHRALLEPFRIADRLVTCGEWLEFMADGGYTRHELWLSDGWHQVQAEHIDSPLYWQPDGSGSWLQHTLTGVRPVNFAEPVCHVSHYEADAFATWAGARLPSEAEWEHAVNVHAAPDIDDVEPETQRWHPQPARECDGTLRQAFGDVWQWTSSAYLGYPGFTIAPGAIGEYNGKFMSNQMVLRGSCALTPRGHSRPTYRNFFPPHARWMMGGVRLASDQGEVSQ